MIAALYQRQFDDALQETDPRFVAGFADLLAAYTEIERLRAAGADVESDYLVRLGGGEWLTPHGVAVRLGLAPTAEGTPADAPADEPESLAERWPALRLDPMDGADPAGGFIFPGRLVLTCSGSPLPWGTPPEELRAYPAFGLDVR